MINNALETSRAPRFLDLWLFIHELIPSQLFGTEVSSVNYSFRCRHSDPNSTETSCLWHAPLCTWTFYYQFHLFTYLHNTSFLENLLGIQVWQPLLRGRNTRYLSNWWKSKVTIRTPLVVVDDVFTFLHKNLSCSPEHDAENFLVSSHCMERISVIFSQLIKARFK